MLQKFLNQNLISTVKDDAAFSKLQTSARNLANKISKNKTKIQSYTLVAFDPNINADNHIVEEVNKIISKKWNTFIQNTGDTHLTVIRAVILEALELISSDDINDGNLIWLTSRNIIRYYKLGKEKEILIEFLQKLGGQIENQAQTNWSMTFDKKNKIVQAKIVIPKPSNVQSTIEKDIKEAILSIAEGGKNPSSPTLVDGAWGTHFASRVSDIINQVVSSSLIKQGKTISSFLNNQDNGDGDHFQLIDMRTHLLWWKEACYSPVKDMSYIEISKAVLPIVMPFDYSRFVPVLYPLSADYFLREVFQKVYNGDNKKIKLTEIIKRFKEQSKEIESFIPGYHADYNNRISLLAFVSGFLKGDYSLKNINKLIGINGSDEISMTEIMLWLFHDFQSIKIISQK